MSPFFVSGSIEPSIVDGSEDGEPLAETNVHLMAIVAITAVLKHHLVNAIATLHCELAEAKELAEAEADRLREKLRALGVDPD
jgi:hypothetical protein